MGFVVTKNWDKIENITKSSLQNSGSKLASLQTSFARFIATKKENIEDMIAEAKEKLFSDNEDVETVPGNGSSVDKEESMTE